MTETARAPQRGWKLGTMKRAKLGWIGVDIGSQAIKLVQLERTGTSLHIAARWTLVDPTAGILQREDLCAEGLQKRLCDMKKLRRLFVGQACAAVLPMSLVDFRTLEIPAGDATEQRRMVAEELAADLGQEPADLAFDFWPISRSPAAGEELTQVATLAVPLSVAAGVAKQLLQAGLECQTLDGVPCALARAVAMAETPLDDQVSLALDLGYRSPLLVLVKQGRPVFSRILRAGSLQSIMRPLIDQLQLSPAECNQLLSSYGVPAPHQPVSLVAQKTMPLIAAPLHQLVDEVTRTTDYMAQQFRGLQPRQLWLFGGGSQINHLDAYLGDKLQIPTSLWNLPGEPPDASAALYGQATGLSALAWEVAACT